MWDKTTLHNVSLKLTTVHSYPRGGGGGGVLHQSFGTWVQHAKKTWTQSDIRFCENEVSNRFKINEKGGHLDRKYTRKIIQNA